MSGTAFSPRAAIHVHFRNAQGQLCAEDPMRSVGPAISATTDWKRGVSDQLTFDEIIMDQSPHGL